MNQKVNEMASDMRVNVLSDHQLLDQFEKVVLLERGATVGVIVYIAEIYKRQLYAKLGYSSLFGYLQEKFNYSGSGAYRRIQAAKLSLKVPEILEYLEAGKLNLTSISQIEPYLTAQNKTELLDQVLGKTKEEIEYLLSVLFPSKEGIKVKDTIRRLPVIQKIIDPKPTDNGRLNGLAHGHSSNHIAGRLPPQQKESKLTAAAAVNLEAENKKGTPFMELSAQYEVKEVRRVKITFVADETIAQKIEKAKKLLSHKYPQGKLEDILSDALDLLLEKKDPAGKPQQKQANAQKSGVSMKSEKALISSESRYIAVNLKREVWKRDQARCTYESAFGKRCDSQQFIQIDHIEPWSLGGTHTQQNLRLLCATHNQFRAQKTFGERGSLLKMKNKLI